MKAININSIKAETQVKLSALFVECGVFFAFSNEQFMESKTPLTEGDKYVSFGGGGYCPKSLYPAFDTGFDALTKWEKTAIKAAKLDDALILHELSNHECWYTCDISDALGALPQYTSKHVQAVYNLNKKEYQKNL